MNNCPQSSDMCINCHAFYQQLRPHVKQVILSKHFERDIKDVSDFDVNHIIDCKHEYFRRLHKFEETISGNHIFRAIKKNIHIVYAIDKDYRLIFLRAFHNFISYKKFLDDKKGIVDMIERVE